MTLARPEWLWTLTVLPPLSLVAALARARRSRDWSALGQGGTPASDRSAFWLVALMLLTVALAQPRWGRSSGTPLPPGHDVVIAVDVSRSMAAIDAVPDRLGVAVESAASLLETLGREEGDRVAVVAFAGRGVLRCPLTTDLGAAAEILRSLRPGGVSTGGTDLGAALDAALDAFDDQERTGGRSVVVISDGEDHDGRWQSAAERLRARGVLVHTVAVGDSDVGHPVPSRPGQGDEPIRYRGSIVLSRRTDGPLSAIAATTGGAFVPLGLATVDLGRLYRTRIAPEARVYRRANLVPEQAERFPIFLIAALGFILAASVPGRPSGRGFVAALAVGLIGANPPEAVEQGRAAYAVGNHVEALASFRAAMQLAPGDAVPAYDAAASLYQLRRFDEARALYLAARRRAGVSLRTKIDYALGNTEASRGDFAASIRHYDNCLASTAPGPVLDRIRRDAAINRRFAEDQARTAPGAPESGVEKKADTQSGLGTSPPKEGRSPGPGGDGSKNTNATPGNQRGAGGAGGGGPALARPGSPEDQLSRALNNVREARRHRIEETDGDDIQEDRKDW